jgi:hypothetical protein
MTFPSKQRFVEMDGGFDAQLLHRKMFGISQNAVILYMIIIAIEIFFLSLLLLTEIG